MRAFFFTPNLRRLVELTSRPNSPLRNITIWVEGGLIPWAVRNGRCLPLPLGRRAP